MSLRSTFATIAAHEDLNFLLTNRIPRTAFTRFMGWFSKIELPVVSAASIALWRFFCDVDLTDAADSRFRSLHAAFTRGLQQGARAVDGDPATVVAPCDGIVGAFGRVREGQVHQIKGFPYGLDDLLGYPEHAARYRDGWFVTLRLTAGMYHRFHAPHDLTIEQVRYISGDTWNVNPIALKRIERLFCKNERAVIQTRLASGQMLTLVPVAAILVASIRLHFLDVTMNMNYRGAAGIDCDARFAKGDELGWFEHGSTIILFAPPGFRLCEDITQGTVIRMGRALMHLPTVVT